MNEPGLYHVQFLRLNQNNEPNLDPPASGYEHMSIAPIACGMA